MKKFRVSAKSQGWCTPMHWCKRDQERERKKEASGLHFQCALFTQSQPHEGRGFTETGPVQITNKKALRRRLVPSFQVIFCSLMLWITRLFLVNALKLPDDRKHPHYKWETGPKFQKLKLWGFFLNATVGGNMELCKFMLIRMICWYIHIFWI